MVKVGKVAKKLTNSAKSLRGSVGLGKLDMKWFLIGLLVIIVIVALYFYFNRGGRREYFYEGFQAVNVNEDILITNLAKYIIDRKNNNTANNGLSNLLSQLNTDENTIRPYISSIYNLYQSAPPSFFNINTVFGRIMNEKQNVIKSQFDNLRSSARAAPPPPQTTAASNTVQVDEDKLIANITKYIIDRKNNNTAKNGSNLLTQQLNNTINEMSAQLNNFYNRYNSMVPFVSEVELKNNINNQKNFDQALRNIFNELKSKARAPSPPPATTTAVPNTFTVNDNMLLANIVKYIIDRRNNNTAKNGSNLLTQQLNNNINEMSQQLNRLYEMFNPMVQYLNEETMITNISNIKNNDQAVRNIFDELKSKARAPSPPPATITSMSPSPSMTSMSPSPSMMSMSPSPSITSMSPSPSMISMSPSPSMISMSPSTSIAPSSCPPCPPCEFIRNPSYTR